MMRLSNRYEQTLNTIKQIIEETEESNHLKKGSILSRSNLAYIVGARQRAIHKAKLVTGATNEELAEAFGRHECTIRYALKKIEELQKVWEGVF